MKINKGIFNYGNISYGLGMTFLILYALSIVFPEKNVFRKFIDEIINYEVIFSICLFYFLIEVLLKYLRYNNISKEKNYVMLSKSDYSILFYLIIIALNVFLFIKQTNTLFTVIFIFISFVLILFDYVISKKRFIKFENDIIQTIDKRKDRKTSEITSFEIYPNNIEIIFNDKEILFIYQRDVIYPKWEVFTSKMIELKQKINKTE